MNLSLTIVATIIAHAKIVDGLFNAAKSQKGDRSSPCSASLKDLRVCLGIREGDGGTEKFLHCIDDESALPMCKRICENDEGCSPYGNDCREQTIAYYECENSLVSGACRCGLAEEIDIDVKNLRA
mmetsp:Transcript_8246/g.14915  ORF Transcript_8246/g.14915 Transcript_8246/m.14915 type:complete len:126 (-) Transcript_8246:346-723(-)|eukprot:CAMPEP_0201627926 /NCGR_PEP_ID=MMETSP0493-20130528/3009_1 /ASSEMBLY_ACC=CAM_ASM_000838 /TAXON_ID=420259 /ORGANISM="Thalassiosira gravida, Strain GMp14c1" /LENGTH=125 /DNA_ID=CAMNT_0048098537 /DNA_START=97 /DNA_END=474 /DNA_ORIENTATION=-